MVATPAPFVSYGNTIPPVSKGRDLESISRAPTATGLKFQPERKLDDPRGACSDHLSKLSVHLFTAGIKPCCAIHRLVLRVVERIEHLALELQAARFTLE